jgi:hypothetical protein
MSKIKEAIKTAQTNVSKAAINTYGARVYDFEQVCKILEDLYDVANEAGSEDTAGKITQAQIDQLVALIETRIDANIHNMSDSDVVDSDSIEMSISGGRATVEDIDVDNYYTGMAAKKGKLSAVEMD